MELTKLLKDNGYSLTKPRQRVFNKLAQSGPISIAELIKATGGIDRVSVYRTLALFDKLGVVTRINSGWKTKYELSDAFSHHHHHLSCINCGRVININEDKLESFLNLLAADQHFLPSAHQVEIQGVCNSCRQLKS